jgi:predicted amino acid-binding ACT domain protein
MQLIQHIFHTFLSIAEKVLDACENGVDYSQFQRELQEKFNKLGCEI